MKKFISYEKIFNNDNKWIISEKDYRQWKKIDWVVTEKIHGANFCMIVNDGEVQYAKRKSILTPGENFFGYQKIAVRYKNNIIKAYEFLKDKQPEIDTLLIYGELFGGKYPHPEVINNEKPIQTGVYYSPEIEFFVFDIAYIKKGVRKYVDFKTMAKICDYSELPYIPALFVGTYEKAMSFECGFETTIPKILGYPPLEDNYAEGIVIKPCEHVFVKTRKGFDTRPVIKKKIAAFSETKYDEAVKWSPQKNDYMELIELYITKNRLHNVLSKMGEFDFKNTQEKQKLIDNFAVDICEQMEEDYEEIDILDPEWMSKVFLKVENFIEENL